MQYFKDISIRFKILFIALVGVLGFLTYLIFNYLAIEKNNLRLQEIKNIHFPTIELIDTNISRLHRIKSTLTLAISLEQEELIEETSKLAHEVHHNLNEIAKINPKLSITMSYFARKFFEYYKIAQLLTSDILFLRSSSEQLESRADDMHKSYKNIDKLLNDYRESSYMNFSETINKANSDSVKTLYTGLIIGFTLIATLGLAAFFVSNMITKGVRNVMIAFQQMVAGNYSIDIDYTSDDEIGQLSDVYIRTSQRLKFIMEELKQTLNKSQKSASELKRAQNIAHMGNWEYDKKLKKLFLADEVYTMFGLPLGSTIHPKHIEELTHQDDLHLLKNFVSSVNKFKKPQEVEFRMLDANRQERSLYVLAEPLLDINKNILGLFGVVQDITDRRIADRKAQTEHLEKLAAESANRAKSDFLANMSHELRTPLNAIIGYSEILMEDLENSELTTPVEDAGRIQTAGKYLLSLINEVLDLSKIEAGKMDLIIEEFDIDNLIKDISETSQPLVMLNNNAFNIDCDPEQITLKTDKTKIRQALYNLISNAAKFTKNGVITLNIFQDNVGSKSWVVFEVKDTGIGMSPDVLEKIYEPFVQADRTTSQNFGGTGLGLTITKEFLKLMGGNICAQTEPGKGTTFTIRIPQQINEKGVSDTAKIKTGQFVTSSTQGYQLQETKRILVIDDEVIVRNMIERYLHSQGFLVDTAENGSIGLRKVTNNRPDVILLDILMPGMDGWAVLKKIKDHDELRRIPVIVVSEASNQSLAYSLGATNYLNKPFNLVDLYKIVTECLQITSENSTV